jgi:hypothetical protein
LIAPAVPLMVTAPLPLALMAAPANATAVTTPWLTLTVVVSPTLSTSATVSALPVPLPNTSAVSSVAPCAPGTVFTGDWLTAVTATLTGPVSVTPAALTV